MKRILIIFMTIGLLLMCSCGINKSTTDEALGVLLNSDNYKCGMSIRTEETVNELDRGGIRTIFHNPYKSKVARVFEHPDEQGIISMVQYGVEKGGNYEIKYIYTYENGDTKEWGYEDLNYEEYTIVQI